MAQDIGNTGLEEWSGQIREDFLREFQGREAYKRYNEMRLNSPTIGALLNAYKRPLLSMTWEFRSDDGEDDPRLELCDDSLRYMTHAFKTFLNDCLTFLDFGFSIASINYQRDEAGRVLWRKFKPLGQNTVLRWLIDEGGGIQGFVQQAAPVYKTEMLDIAELLLFRINTEKNNPEGRSILRQAWIPYFYGKTIMQIEGIGVERDLAGLPKIKLPQNATTDETDTNSDAYKAAKIGRNIRNDQQASLVVPFGWEVELLSSGGSKQFDTDKIINRYNTLMLMSAHAQFLMLGQEGVGSLALSADQTDFFTLSLDGTADIICDTITQFALPRLMALNGYDADGLTFVHSPAARQSGSAIAAMLAQLVNYLHWSDEDESWLRGLLNMPELDPELAEKQDAEKAQAEAQAKAEAQARIEQVNQTKEQNANEEPGEKPDEKESEGKGQMTARFRDALARFNQLITGRKSAATNYGVRKAGAFKAFGESMAAVMEAASTPPEINVSVPEQPAPIVNVTVNPAPVYIQPTPAPAVTVSAPQVVVNAPPVNVAAPAVTVENKMPRVAREVQTVNRDANGNIVSTETRTMYEGE